jgi:sugar phosphate isomerase/epimerase
MKKLNRRDFIGHGTKGITAAMVLSQIPASLFAEARFLNMPIGFQSYAIKDILVADFPGTLKMMSGMGYQQVEMCSPSGYVDSGFGPLVGMKTSDMKKIIVDSGLMCPSCHFTFDEMKDKLDDRIEFAHQLGLSQMVCSSFWLKKDATLDDYLASCDTLNKIGEKIKKAGMKTGYHNHEMEFAVLDGKLIYDALMGRLDPALVQMQFQTEVINLGFKASTYFNKYPGRFISSHMSDWTAEKKQVPIGQGIIDWKEFFISAKTGGVQNFFVEMELPTFKPSADYIHKLA